MIINKNELFVLLNQYLLEGKREISISYPPFEINLFTVNFNSWHIENVIERKEFERKRRKYGKNEFLREELPDFHDLLDIFLSSGVIGFENDSEIKENLELLSAAVKDSTVYVKPLFIGIDTNIAYYRIISRRFKNHFKYVLSNIVVDEIDARIHSKYSSKMLRYFEELQYGKLMSEFANGSAKDARKAKNAMNEIYYITNNLDAFRIGKNTGTRDKEIRDREIARQYREFSDEIKAEVVLLTADKDMVFHAKANELSSIYFKLPHTLKNHYRIDAKTLENLIYDLTVVFGIVKIGDNILFGEWRGKSSEDYFNENLKIYNFKPEMVKDLEICRGVLNEFQRNES